MGSLSLSLTVGVVSSFRPVKARLLKGGVVLARAGGSMHVRGVAKEVETSNKREPRGIMKPKRVSEEMRVFLGGVEEIPRTQALKHIWAYIKQHDLQDPENKKVIVCDENLKKIFAGKDRVGFLEIAGLISPHFLK